MGKHFVKTWQEHISVASGLRQSCSCHCSHSCDRFQLKKIIWRETSGAAEECFRLDIHVDQLSLMPGKGEKTAFNLKDVVVLTAGPGWVKDPQERGVSVSWKIGCGDSITGLSCL